MTEVTTRPPANSLSLIANVRTHLDSQCRVSGKPIHLRLKGQDFAALDQAVRTARARMDEIGGIVRAVYRNRRGEAAIDREDGRFGYAFD